MDWYQIAVIALALAPPAQPEKKPPKRPDPFAAHEAQGPQEPARISHAAPPPSADAEGSLRLQELQRRHLEQQIALQRAQLAEISEGPEGQAARKLAQKDAMRAMKHERRMRQEPYDGLVHLILGPIAIGMGGALVASGAIVPEGMKTPFFVSSLPFFIGGTVLTIVGIAQRSKHRRWQGRMRDMHPQPLSVTLQRWNPI